MSEGGEYHELFKRYARRPFRLRKKTTPLLAPSPTIAVTTTAPSTTPDSNDIWWILPELRAFPTNQTMDAPGGMMATNGTAWEEVLAADRDTLYFPNLTNLTLVDFNMTREDGEEVNLVMAVALGVVLGLMILATIIGNVFVIIAILLERNLQNVANYLILSLAVADLLVACLVMPLAAIYQVSRHWTLGPELCDLWTSCDVLCCTSSILHLVAIALDRYWAVTNVDYIHKRTAHRIGIMILIIWVVSFLVCIAPLLGWKDPLWEERITRQQTCLVSQDIGYQIFATACSFYLPLLVILVLYWRIFQAARKRIRRRVTASAASSVGSSRVPPGGGVMAGLCAAGAAGGSGGIAAAVVGVIGRPLPTISEATTTTTTTAFTNVSSTNTSPEKGSFGNGLEADPPTVDLGSCQYQPPPAHPHPPKRKTKENADSKRERKAAKTLAIITGAFVICWLPFFIMAILLPIYNGSNFPPYIIAFFLWLGYLNSMLNPIIYTIFSPEFRNAFKRILCGRRNSVRRRHRHLGVRYMH
uniref:Serotonin receptor 1B n=1 Tax=Nephotettix cincticeps TaxID=94400 RepID=A0A481S9P3_NEPCI|nr:serotonin receptor 1B [Nephotettix cincticeps]